MKNSLPKNFYASAMHAGLYKKKSKPDVVLFYSSKPCSTAAVFTSNRVKAAPVVLSNKHVIGSGDSIRAVIMNSGCANACTGSEGYRNAMNECVTVSKVLGINPYHVVVASTGVIGVQLPIKKLVNGIVELGKRVKLSFGNKKLIPSDTTYLARAIMTTDTFPKIVSKKFVIDGKVCTLWSCAKGAGMIHPELVPSGKLHATFLCTILTDTAVARKVLDTALREVTQKTFNCVTVDGDTSTNDTVFLLANGAAGNKCISSTKTAGYKKLYSALMETTRELAEMLARDGEGATKFVKIIVQNAPSYALAREAGRVVATSPLVKTAVYGADPNWGRIMAALGRAKVEVVPEKIDIYFDGISIVHNGRGVEKNAGKLHKVMLRKEFEVRINLKLGKESATVYTCDFSYDYVKINADYTT
ncbi:MAG: bifunctional glutamate N-acetyltransferase/amino-acid acetyltransferase ArgJ [Elusimicrobiota bacterium]